MPKLSWPSFNKKNFVWNVLGLPRCGRYSVACRWRGLGYRSPGAIVAASAQVFFLLYKIFFLCVSLCIAFKSCTVMLITKNWLFLTLWFSFQRAKDGNCWGWLHFLLVHSHLSASGLDSRRGTKGTRLRTTRRRRGSKVGAPLVSSVPNFSRARACILLAPLFFPKN